MAKSRFQYSTEPLTALQSFDLLICACGYESRSRFIAEHLASRVKRAISYGYPENQTHSYQKNADVLSRLGDVREPTSLSHFRSELTGDLMSALEGESTPLALAIDISSFDRGRIATIVRVLDEVAAERELDVTFIYAIGSFESHEGAAEATVLTNSPLEGFEGWTSDPSRPVVCVIGLGFENLVALAALETLEPARTVAFVAESADDRFIARVRRDNQALMNSPEVAVVPYGIDTPFAALQQLEGVVHALRSRHRVALVPLGPKIFALLALLVARESPSEVAVWRVSADQGANPQDRTASGALTSLRVRMEPTVVPNSQAISGDGNAEGAAQSNTPST